MSELGPYYPTPGGKLQKNQYAWNQIANIVFLESPAFVGWSYSNTSTDIVVGMSQVLSSHSTMYDISASGLTKYKAGDAQNHR